MRLDVPALVAIGPDPEAVHAVRRVINVVDDYVAFVLQQSWASDQRTESPAAFEEEVTAVERQAASQAPTREGPDCVWPLLDDVLHGVQCSS